MCSQSQSASSDEEALSRRDAELHVEAAFEAWHARSLTTWELDLGILTGAGVGVGVRRPPKADERRRIAGRSPGAGAGTGSAGRSR